MICPRCGSGNVNVQLASVVKSKHHGCLYWVVIGWWLELFMWIFLTLPWLIAKIFKPNKVNTKVSSYGVCQNCGHKWKV